MRGRDSVSGMFTNAVGVISRCNRSVALSKIQTVAESFGAEFAAETAN